MKNHYDLLILNNCPAFYKINLYNEIAKQKKIFVVFIGYYDQVLIDEKFKQNINFPFKMLNETFLNQRNLFTSFLKLQKIIRSLTYKKIIFGGYVDPEFIITSFTTPRKKNVLQTESAGETKLSGIRFYIKKVILTRFSSAIASGTIHKSMLRKMGFAENVIVSYGVGLINTKENETPLRETDSQLKFLYVGRLIELKNLDRLIQVFNQLGYPLTIVGKGILEEELKLKAKSNIKFLGFVNNKDLPDLYGQHQIFILPSLSEAWGLVVEEALYNGCVLCLSKRVGSYLDLLVKPKTGTFFDPVNNSEMAAAINYTVDNYAKFKENVDHLDISKKNQIQINTYVTEIFKNSKIAG